MRFLKNIITRLKTYAFLLVIFLSSFLSAEKSLAQKPYIGKPAHIPGASESGQNYFIETFIPFLVKIFSAACGGFAFIMLVFSGVQYLTAYGNEEQINSAKKTAIWSIVGLLIILASYSIVSIITNLELPSNAPPPPTK